MSETRITVHTNTRWCPECGGVQSHVGTDSLPMPFRMCACSDVKPGPHSTHNDADIDALKAQLSAALETAIAPYCLKHPGAYEAHILLNHVVGGFPTDYVLSFEIGIDTSASQAKRNGEQE